jgi:hypothetical protein
LAATGPDGTYTFQITFTSPVTDEFVLYKLPGWTITPYTIIGSNTIEVELEIIDGEVDPPFILATNIEPAIIEGLTYEVKGIALEGVTITLDGDAAVLSDSEGFYQIMVPTLGEHTIVASKTGYKDQTGVLSVTEFGAEYTLNFQGVNGLVPNAPDIWYTFDCVALWKFPPAEHPEYALDIWKVFDVVAAWKFPI